MSSSEMAILEVISRFRDLIDGDRAAQVALEVVQGDLALLEPLVEFLLRVRRLDLVQLLVDFFVGGQQAELFGALHQDFVVDQLLQDTELEAGGLLVAGLLRRRGGLIGVVLLHFRAQDFAAVDFGHDVGSGLAAVAGGKGNQQRKENDEDCGAGRAKPAKSANQVVPPK